MYKAKPHSDCKLPAKEQLNVLVLNGSLKHNADISNTGELSEEVVRCLRAECEIKAESVRLSDMRIPVGLGFKESDDDEWPGIVTKNKAADIVIFATPIWWGGRSSLMQRVIPRMAHSPHWARL